MSEIKDEIRMRWTVVFAYCLAVFAAIAVVHFVSKWGM